MTTYVMIAIAGPATIDRIGAFPNQEMCEAAKKHPHQIIVPKADVGLPTKCVPAATLVGK